MSAFAPRHKDICTEFQRQAFEDHEAITIDVKKCPVGSRHWATVPANAAKKSPYLCGARSWSHEENKPVLSHLQYLWLEPIYIYIYKFNQIPSNSRPWSIMIHLHSNLHTDNSAASLNLKLRSVLKHFGAAKFWICCSSQLQEENRLVFFSGFSVRELGAVFFHIFPLPPSCLFKRRASKSIISLRRSSCTALKPGIARPTMVTCEFQASKGWNLRRSAVGKWKNLENLSLKIWSDRTASAKTLKALTLSKATLGFLSFWTFFAVQWRPCHRQDL